MISHELAVQQLEPPNPQSRNQPGECDLGRIGRAAEHAFPKEGASQRYAVKPAHQPAVQPAFDTMGIAHTKKLHAGFLNRAVDPAFRPVWRRRRAMSQDGGKIPVRGHAKPVLADRLAQGAREVNGVERQYRALFWLHPENFRIVPAVRHREYAHGIGAQQDVEIDRHYLSEVAKIWRDSRGKEG